MSGFKVGDRVRVTGAPIGLDDLVGKRGTVTALGQSVRVTVHVDGGAHWHFHCCELVLVKPKRRHSRKQVVAKLRKQVANIEANPLAGCEDRRLIMAYEAAIDLLVDVED